MKICLKCGSLLPLAEFYRHPQMADGRLNKCKGCTKQDTRDRYAVTRGERSAYEQKRSCDPARRAKHVLYQKRRRARSPEKVAARNAVTNAVRDGRMSRKPCEVCGSPDSEAHHDDYSRPLDVRWLCFKHHREAHGQTVTVTTKRRREAIPCDS